MLLAPDEAVELGDQEDALEVLAEEQSTEIRDLAVLQGVDASPLGQPLELLQLVQDRAAQAEQLEALLDEKGEPEAEVYDLAEEVPPEMYAHLVPEEPSAAPMRDQPKTLIHVLQQTLTKKLPEFELGEDTGVGMLACVRRGVALLGPMRHFCRFARLEEGKLSEAMLEKESASLNMWNKTEHELVVKSTGNAGGVRAVSEFRPPVSSEDEKWQVVILEQGGARCSDDRLPRECVPEGQVTGAGPDGKTHVCQLAGCLHKNGACDTAAAECR